MRARRRGSIGIVLACVSFVSAPALSALFATIMAQVRRDAKRQNVVRANRIVLNHAMSKQQVKAILDRVLTWPPERQEDAATILMAMEVSDSSQYRLTDEQADEVRRRLADTDAETMKLDEFNAHFERRLDL